MGQTDRWKNSMLSVAKDILDQDKLNGCGSSFAEG